MAVNAMGWSPWGAGCVNCARPVLGGGDAQSIESKLYAKLETESPLYSIEVRERLESSGGCNSRTR